MNWLKQTFGASLDVWEMVLAVVIITLPDFLLSDVIDLPMALPSDVLFTFARAEITISGYELLVPFLVCAALVVFRSRKEKTIVHTIGVLYTAWVTIHLIMSVGLVLFTVLARPERVGSRLMLDTLVLWFSNVLVFGVWYWLIDSGGPWSRRANALRRIDFAFPQRMTTFPGWEGWQPGFVDYVYLAFSGSTQFGLGDTAILSQRAKLLITVQTTISVSILVFLASISVGLINPK